MTRSAATTAARWWAVTGCTVLAWLVLAAMPEPSVARHHFASSPTQ